MVTNGLQKTLRKVMMKKDEWCVTFVHKLLDFACFAPMPPSFDE